MDGSGDVASATIETRSAEEPGSQRVRTHLGRAPVTKKKPNGIGGAVSDGTRIATTTQEHIPHSLHPDINRRASAYNYNGVAGSPPSTSTAFAQGRPNPSSWGFPSGADHGFPNDAPYTALAPQQHGVYECHYPPSNTHYESTQKSISVHHPRTNHLSNQLSPQTPAHASHAAIASLARIQPSDPQPTWSAEPTNPYTAYQVFPFDPSAAAAGIEPIHPQHHQTPNPYRLSTHLDNQSASNFLLGSTLPPAYAYGPSQSGQTAMTSPINPSRQVDVTQQAYRLDISHPASAGNMTDRVRFADPNDTPLHASAYRPGTAESNDPSGSPPGVWLPYGAPPDGTGDLRRVDMLYQAQLSNPSHQMPHGFQETFNRPSSASPSSSHVVKRRADGGTNASDGSGGEGNRDEVDEYDGPGDASMDLGYESKEPSGGDPVSEARPTSPVYREDKRKTQNKLAQRAFRARSKVQNKEVGLARQTCSCNR